MPKSEKGSLPVFGATVQPNLQDSRLEHDANPATGAQGAREPIDDDVQLLHHLGYNQELRRRFNRWSTVSYAISVLGVLGSQPATYGTPISVGGPATAVWAWAIGSVMAYIIASSVAELVSAYPTAGGMYFVTKHVVPAKRVAIWAWIIGWCNFLGQACGVASLAYTVGQMILALASMNSGLLSDGYTYSPAPWQIVLIAILVLAIWGAICSLTTNALSNIILWFAPINILATIAICIAVPLATPSDKIRSARSVFTEITDGSGWDSKALSFFLGFLNVAWVMTDYDGTTHMSEETVDAAARGPLAIRLAVIVSGILGFGLNVAFTFCLPPDYETSILESHTGLPVAQIFLNAGGRAGASVMLFFVILVQFFTGTSAMLANARMTYAFARDNALPFSRFWAKINRTTETPVHAVWLVVAFCICLNLIGIGSTETITAIFNLCAPALDLSYIAVLFAHLWYTYYRQEVEFVPGKYTMKFLRIPRKILAIAWVLFISTILFFPPTKPITAANMNYAVVVAAAVAVFALSWWWLGARHKYKGPITQETEILAPGRHGDEEEASRRPAATAHMDPPPYSTAAKQGESNVTSVLASRSFTSGSSAV
ncbi:amino acid permease like [Lecanosticta acicola]|uniref:Amino acid permease like n=1 Tax=Lecanosticta acicola TaxID=111012 RepID=A0AAI8YV16_9PEZI|nr:amino acid permease like [Lecanosticta acicola]